MGLTQVNTSYYLGQSYHMGQNMYIVSGIEAEMTKFSLYNQDYNDPIGRNE